MSALYTCDECGKQETSLSGWQNVGWWGFTPKGEPHRRDFCSDACIATFYSRKAGVVIATPDDSEELRRHRILSASVAGFTRPEGDGKDA